MAMDDLTALVEQAREAFAACKDPAALVDMGLALARLASPRTRPSSAKRRMSGRSHAR